MSATSENSTELQPSRPRLVPVNDWARYHPWPPVGGLRHLIFHAETNGFKTAFIRVGKRVLVNESEFFACANRCTHTAQPKPRQRRQKAKAQDAAGA